jgi:hypothetical protein
MRRNAARPKYNQIMARGWESKSVEEQMAASQQSSIFSGSAQDLRKQQVDKAHLSGKISFRSELRIPDAGRP